MSQPPALPTRRASLAFLFPAVLLACGSPDALDTDSPGAAGGATSGQPGAGAGGGTSSGGASTASGAGSGFDLGNLPTTPGDGTGTGGTPLQEKQIVTALPPGFTASDNSGGWLVHEGAPPADAVCTNILRGIARDFPASHVDFQEGFTELLLGIVDPALGADRKPVFVGVDMPDDLVTSAATFAEWYNNIEGVNQPFVIDLWMEPVGDTFVFDSASFFPLDGVGYALQECVEPEAPEEPVDPEEPTRPGRPGGGFPVFGGPCDGQDTGFHFTTELHTKFQYNGGEEFVFRGDDDVWVYINGKLALDLGGVHPAEAGTVLLDDEAATLGLTVGGVYDLDLFQAERFTTDSNFRIETTLDFTECGEILPEDVIR